MDSAVLLIFKNIYQLVLTSLRRILEFKKWLVFSLFIYKAVNKSHRNMTFTQASYRLRNHEFPTFYSFKCSCCDRIILQSHLSGYVLVIIRQLADFNPSNDCYYWGGCTYRCCVGGCI